FRMTGMEHAYDQDWCWLAQYRVGHPPGRGAWRPLLVCRAGPDRAGTEDRTGAATRPMSTSARDQAEEVEASRLRRQVGHHRQRQRAHDQRRRPGLIDVALTPSGRMVAM